MKNNKTFLKKHGAVIIWIVAAIAIIVSAYLLKGTKYENAWLYILGVGAILSGVFETYSKNKDRDKQ